MFSTDLFSDLRGPFASVRVGTVMDERNRDEMLEPPPVYNVNVFPGRRDTAD